MKISFNLFGFRRIENIREFWILAFGDGMSESRSLFSIKVEKNKQAYIEFMFLRFTVRERRI